MKQDGRHARELANLRLTLAPDARSGARIKVVGVGGGGSNAVDRMVEVGLGGVEFIVANTDVQALDHNQAGQKVQIDGVGRRFNGVYFITKTTHTINDSGYITKFTAHREQPLARDAGSP